MWIAVIISVCLAVEILSYLSGGQDETAKDTKIRAEEGTR